MHFMGAVGNPGVRGTRLRGAPKKSLIKRACIGAFQGLSVSLLVSGLVGAQSARDSSLYVRAQQMVANGDAANGRKLADSVAIAAPAGSAAYAEGLFWRATLAANARDSEHYYRQIIVDYPLSGRVPDALLRIGQLEAARGENPAALQHFQRLVLEHPQSPLRADASYWVARMYFDANDASRACTANADALTSVAASNVELKNRIDFQQQRCRGVALATSHASAPVAVPVRNVPTAAPAPAKAAAKAAPKTVAKVASKAPEADRGDTNANAAPSASAAASGSNSGGSSVVSRPPTDEEVARALASAEHPASARALKVGMPKAPAATKTANEPTSTPARNTAEPAEKSSSVRNVVSYAVQVAAFGVKSQADVLAAKLRGRGYKTYVDGTSAPYRVRVGRYPTHAAATEALAKLKAKHMDGFVVER